VCAFKNGDVGKSNEPIDRAAQCYVIADRFLWETPACAPRRTRDRAFGDHTSANYVGCAEQQTCTTAAADRRIFNGKLLLSPRGEFRTILPVYSCSAVLQRRWDARRW
jgi:hypothetical protein